MRQFYFLLMGMALCLAVRAQSLHGKVTASDTRKPVAGANVYLSNTSVGTITNEKGEFTIAPFPAGRYDLIVSFMGYEPQNVTVQSNKLPASLDITLKPKVEELQEVVLEPYEKNGWEKWGSFFIENFIGTSAGALDCKLLNKEVIRFRFNRKQNTLKAVADDRLIIENKHLGYHLKYDLVKFEYNFSTHMFVYMGYPQFEEMDPKRARQKRNWIKNREEVYYGSMLHFMRSLYRNKLVEQHFEVRRIIRIPEAEKKRVKNIYQARILARSAGGNVFVGNGYEGLPPDTAAYYKKVMQQPESMDVLIDRVLPGDSIAFAIDSTIAGFEFSDWLQVIYTKKNAPEEYYRSIRKPYMIAPIVSELNRTSDDPIMVWSNGAYYEGTSLISTLYWSWSEKIANLLPIDYWPERR